MIKKEHTILNERYRPTTLENYLGSPDNKAKFQEFIDKQDLPHLGFFGQTGAGKTTLAKILAKNIDCSFIILNATEDRSIESIKEKVGSFASSNSFKPLKIVILDEATHLLEASQVLLLNMIEQFSLKTRFILTGNYPERLIAPLRGRLQEFELVAPTKKQIAEHVSNILDEEQIKYNLEDLAFIINKSYPDIRKTINNCQKFTINNELILDKKAILAEEEYIDKIIDELKKPSNKSFNIIRQHIVDSGSSEFDNVYKQLYERLSDYAGGLEGTVTIILEEMLYHKNFRIDQEINLCACVARILEVLQTKKLIKG